MVGPKSQRLTWIDTSCTCGRAGSRDAGTPAAAGLVDEMDRLGIDRALVTTAWSDVISAELANEQLFHDLAPYDRLLPVPEILPEGGERFLDRQADAVADLIARGAVAGVFRCGKNKFPLTTWCVGDMLEAMQSTRLPLMVSHDDVDPDQLYHVLRDFPSLPVILQEVPRVGYNRIVFPLMARCPNLFPVCDPPSFVHLGVEYLVTRFGAHRLVWGTRFPVSEGGAAIAAITYADISDDDRAAIAGGTIQRLLDEVCRG